MKVLIIACLLSVTFAESAMGNDEHAIAICKVDSDTGSDDEQVEGSIIFYKTEWGVAMEIDLEGFDTEDDDMQHGFHIHGSGDMGDGCKKAGGHYNPYNKNHGSPQDAERHVGDLGNIMEDSEGRVKTRMVDSSGLIEFEGQYSIIGRGMVIHETIDDLGRGGAESSLTTGNAGGRLACCVIRELEEEPPSASSALYASGLLVITATLLAIINQ